MKHKMIKMIKKSNILIALMILSSLCAAFYFYNRLPDMIATHWNAAGEADGFSPKTSIFLLPGITALMAALFFLLPSIDPLKKNILKFREYYDWFIAVFVFYMTYIFILSLLWNLDVKLNMMQALVPAFSALFFYMGLMMEKARQNWFIGIRTPWTLSSEKVWDETHKIGGKSYKAAAVISLLGLVFMEYAIYLIVVPVIFASLACTIYSYISWRKHKEK